MLRHGHAQSQFIHTTHYESVYPDKSNNNGHYHPSYNVHELCASPALNDSLYADKSDKTVHRSSYSYFSLVLWNHKPQKRGRFKALDDHVNASGVGNLVGFRYGVFNEWVRLRRLDDQRIKPENKYAMVSYIAMYGKWLIINKLWNHNKLCTVCTAVCSIQCAWQGVCQCVWICVVYSVDCSVLCVLQYAAVCSSVYPMTVCSVQCAVWGVLYLVCSLCGIVYRV